MEYLHMHVYIHCVIYYTCSVCVHVQVRLLTCIYTAAHLNFNCFSLSLFFFFLCLLSCLSVFEIIDRKLSTIENSVEVASSVDIKRKPVRAQRERGELG